MSFSPLYIEIEPARKELDESTGWVFLEFEAGWCGHCLAAQPKGLFAWYSAQEEHPYVTPAGEQLSADITLIDQGWKEESWNIQPVQQFCGQVGFNNFIPSKGEPNYRRPADSPNILIGDNWHVTFRGGIPLVMTNADHWKLKVHEGLLLEAGQPGVQPATNRRPPQSNRPS